MSQTINSKVAPEVELAAGDQPGAASKGPESSPVLDLCTLVVALADAISVVTVVYRSLAALEIPAAADEEAALRYALGLLHSACRALDTASCRAS